MGDRTYAGIRAGLEEALEWMAALAERRASAGVADGARNLSAKLAEELFNVVVAGEFKRGKTTFVNALLGAEVLPAAVVPLTSIVTAVTWGPRPRAEIQFLDGRIQPVDPAELSRYVTERGNTRNERGVDRAVLHHPSEELRDGVFLVDTPGVGSVYRHNTDIAHAFIPEADAAIFLTSADPPISVTERTFLEAVREEAARMFFVLNKVDYLTGSDREEAVAFTRAVIEEAVGHEIALYPLSARQALAAKVAGDRSAVEASGLAAFERDFRRFLLREKGQVILVSVAGQARKLALDELNSIQVEERSLAVPQEQLARTAQDMERVFAEAMASRDDIRTLLRQAVRTLLRTIEDDLAAFREREAPRLLQETERFVAERDDIRGLRAELDEFVQETLRGRVERWRGEEERRIAATFQKSTARFVEETNRLVERTVRLCAELLDLELSAAAAPAGISPEVRFTYSFSEIPTLLESLLPDGRVFLPKKAALKLFLKELRERVPMLVDKHCGRLRWDYQQRLDRSRIALERELDGRLEATIESLRLGVRRAASERARSGEDARAAGEALAAARRELSDLLVGLEAILPGEPLPAAEGPAA
jgi:GTP-binding protein EngB required for normal cell division